MALLLSGLLGATAAPASLGNKVASIEADRAHLAAGLTSEASGAITIHTLTPQNGGVVKEFADAGGTVFAISWQGPGRPDLRQLLGTRFSAMSGMQHPHGHRMRRTVTMQHSDVVIRSQGHPGAFFGIAYDPNLVPAGFAIDDIH